MKLEELKVYQLSMVMGEEVWDIVIKWDYFLKDTIGIKLNNYINSIGKNYKPNNQITIDLMT